MTFSDGFKKLMTVLAWAIAIFACLVVFLWLTGSIDNPLWFIDSNFMDNNGEFLGYLIMSLVAGSFIILMTPEKYREIAFKLFVPLVLLLILMGLRLRYRLWDNADSLSLNLQWVVFAVSSLLAQLSLTMLALSIIEHKFITNFKKPILTNKKVLVILAVIAVVSLVITFGFAFVGLPHQWII